MRKPSFASRWFVALALIVCSAKALAERIPAPNRSAEAIALQRPRLDDPAAIAQGRSLFRSRCSLCHAMDARGNRAPDITSGEWQTARDDAALAKIIADGIPGTEMTGTSLHDDEVWMVVAYLRTIKGSTKPADARGNAANGERIFWATDKGNCGQCHLVNGRGGRLGPDLSRIGAARSRTALTRDIRRPSVYQPPGYEAISVATRDGRRLKGCRKNEDTFSLQMMTTEEQVVAFLKTDLVEIVDEPRSLMPDYGADRLTDAELDDLLQYLATLRARKRGES